MKINEEINQYMEQIDKLGFEKILTQLSHIKPNCFLV